MTLEDIRQVEQFFGGIVNALVRLQKLEAQVSQDDSWQAKCEKLKDHIRQQEESWRAKASQQQEEIARLTALVHEHDPLIKAREAEALRQQKAAIEARLAAIEPQPAEPEAEEPKENTAPA